MKTYETIFIKLYQSKDFITGQQLAKQLGISRTAVWKSIKTLEDLGVSIETNKQKGYRWVNGDVIIPDQIKENTGIDISYTHTSSSTQLDARHNINQRDITPKLYLASHQTDARGRLGRTFYASKNEGIYMSLHLTPNITFEQMPAYTLMAAAAIVKAISRLTSIETDIKWVNDIYLNDKKIAGILTEAITSVETGLITDVIIGIGINTNLKTIPDDLQHKIGSLFSNEETPITRNELICEIWKIFLTVPEQDLVKVYKDKSIVLGREVSFYRNNKKLTGIVDGISDKGNLFLTLTDGQHIELASGEVSLTSW